MTHLFLYMRSAISHKERMVKVTRCFCCATSNKDCIVKTSIPPPYSPQPLHSRRNCCIEVMCSFFLHMCSYKGGQQVRNKIYSTIPPSFWHWYRWSVRWATGGRGYFLGSHVRGLAFAWTTGGMEWSSIYLCSPFSPVVTFIFYCVVISVAGRWSGLRGVTCAYTSAESPVKRPQFIYLFIYLSIFKGQKVC